MRKYFLSMGLMLLAFSGCEKEFAGKRSYNVRNLNTPYTMKYISVGGDNYLAVSNLNASGDSQTGSIQFYAVANDGNATINNSLSVAIPSNTLDFHFDDTLDRLFVLDRNENRLLVWNLEGDRFVQEMSPTNSKEPFEIKLFGNPVSIAPFDREGDTPYLAILTESQGAIQFVDAQNLEIFGLTDFRNHTKDLDEDIRTNFIAFTDKEFGAQFEMIERSSDRPIENISSGERLGRGTGKIIALPISGGRDNPNFVVASYTDDAIFGFRFDDFSNNANLLWNPKDVIDGANGVHGTKEEGFRGMDLDFAGNLYLSSRSTNTVKILPASLTEINRTDRTRNTNAFAENSTAYDLAIVFEGEGVNPADKKFARLGELVTNGAAAAATKLWVLGLESKKRGSKTSRLYEVDVGSQQVTKTFTFEEGEEPQKLCYIADLDLLAVSASQTNRVYIFDTTQAELVLNATISNPD